LAHTPERKRESMKKLIDPDTKLEDVYLELLLQNGSWQTTPYSWFYYLKSNVSLAAALMSNDDDIEYVQWKINDITHRLIRKENLNDFLKGS
jgi:hypothetical protein